MEKSFIVQAKSLEEALDKAAIVLHCEKERIAYELLQEPRPRRRSEPGKLCKLRVTPVAPSADEVERNSEPDAIWDVAVPFSASELETLPSPIFLAALSDAIAADRSKAQGDEPCKPATDFSVRRNISGNLGAASGPIDHTGDLRIYGNVRKGVSAKATGSITVDGGVETAFLYAGGDIKIAEGLLGTARAANGSICCGFAQGASIEAPNGDIVVRESAMHSQMHAGRAVEVGDILLGGSCYGESLVQARIAGSDSGVLTQLWSGRNRCLEDQIEAMRQLAIQHISRLPECDAVQREFLPLEEHGANCGVENRINLWRAAVRQARLNADLRVLSLQKSTLLGMINCERGSRVCITDRAYPNVKIGIDDAGADIKKLTQFATFSKDYESGGLRITPYN